MTVAAIATTVWQDLTAGSDFSTTASIGKLLATFTFTGSNVNAQSAGNVTVGGYAGGQDPATLILGATASSWNSAATIGAKINSAASAGDPLLNNVPGTYAQGTAGAALGRLSSNTNVYVQFVSAVAQNLMVTLVQGDDYSGTDNFALAWTLGSLPNLTGATAINMEIDGGAVSYAGTLPVNGAGGPQQVVNVPITAAQTAALSLASHTYELKATLSTGHTRTIATGPVVVLQ